MDDFVIARNPDPDSAPPYLLRLPLPRPVVLKSRETWPRTAKVYCHRAEEWPQDAEVVERVPVKSWTARGPAVELVLDRGREHRSQLVFTRLKGGRPAIFWQMPKTNKKARPGVRTPTVRASGNAELEIVVDSGERYPYRFASQQATTVRGKLACGDDGVRRDDRLVAVVERKTLEDLARSLVDGRLAGQLAELATEARAAVVVEERYSRLFTLPYVAPGFVADLLARVQVRWPSVPVFFAETRLADLSAAGELAPAPPTAAAVRAWAVEQGLTVSDRGRVPASVLAAYDASQRAQPDGRD